uniref:KN motif and ankyrin repeat domain-containing protein 2-like isoform X1 n=2 Tax=Myxine glutinosa TaxID=7769 RepID=UPI00358E384B
MSSKDVLDEIECEEDGYCIKAPYGFRIDLDFLKYVENHEKGQSLVGRAQEQSNSVEKHSQDCKHLLQASEPTGSINSSLVFSNDLSLSCSYCAFKDCAEHSVDTKMSKGECYGERPQPETLVQRKLDASKMAATRETASSHFHSPSTATSQLCAVRDQMKAALRGFQALEGQACEVRKLRAELAELKSMHNLSGSNSEQLAASHKQNVTTVVVDTDVEDCDLGSKSLDDVHTLRRHVFSLEKELQETRAQLEMAKMKSAPELEEQSVLETGITRKHNVSDLSKCGRNQEKLHFSDVAVSAKPTMLDARTGPDDSMIPRLRSVAVGEAPEMVTLVGSNQADVEKHSVACGPDEPFATLEYTKPAPLTVCADQVHNLFKKQEILLSSCYDLTCAVSDNTRPQKDPASGTTTDIAQVMCLTSADHRALEASSFTHPLPNHPFENDLLRKSSSVLHPLQPTELPRTSTDIQTSIEPQAASDALVLRSAEQSPRPIERVEIDTVTTFENCVSIPGSISRTCDSNGSRVEKKSFSLSCEDARAFGQADVLFTSSAKVVLSPAAEPKSIMKKGDHEVRVTPKKILQFTGVNGGYESTSSEDSSSDDSSSLESSNEAEKEQEEELKEPMEAGDDDIESVKLGDDLLSACEELKSCLVMEEPLSNFKNEAALAKLRYKWFEAFGSSTSKHSAAAGLLQALRRVSCSLAESMVNMVDVSGNTALHYAISYSNFPIVGLLLDTGVCDVDKPNKAGYNAIMLASLALVTSPKHIEVMRRLLVMGNVNAPASQAGQTPLMLAASHGRVNMVQELLAHGANVNAHDYDGSTALMCACEHGHVEIAGILLAQPGCQAAATDNDGSTALSIALEARHRNIAVLLYAHANFGKAPSTVVPVTGRKRPSADLCVEHK